MEPRLSDLRVATDAEYLSSLVSVVDSLQPALGVPTENGGILSPPIQAQVATLSSSLEALSGLPLSQLSGLAGDVQALAGATNASQVVMGIGGLLDNSAETIAAVATALGVASDALEVIPIVGAVVGGLLNIIGSIIAAGEEAEAEARRRCIQESDVRCGEWAKTTGSQGVQSTSIIGGGASPADHFRLLAYQYQKGGKSYPASTSTLMLMLCGGAAGNFGLSESEYLEAMGIGLPSGAAKAFADQAKKMGFTPAPGLDFETRKKLWKAIQAVMTCVQDPYNLSGKYIGDQGRAAMPIIMDILRTGYEKGLINRQTFINLSRPAFKYTKVDCYIGMDLKNGRPVERTIKEGCGERVRDGLASNLESHIIDFGWKLKNTSLWNNQTGQWRIPATISSASSTRRENGAVSTHDQRMRKVQGQRVQLPSQWSDAMKKNIAQFEAGKGGGGGLLLLGGAILGFLLLRKR